MATVDENALLILKVMREKGFISAYRVSVKELISLTGLSDEEFRQADAYLREAQLVSGTVTFGGQGERFITQLGMEYVKRETPTATQKIRKVAAFLVSFATIVACVAAVIVVPEVRTLIGLTTQSPPPTQSTMPPVTTTSSPTLTLTGTSSSTPTNTQTPSTTRTPIETPTALKFNPVLYGTPDPTSFQTEQMDTYLMSLLGTVVDRIPSERRRIAYQEFEHGIMIFFPDAPKNQRIYVLYQDGLYEGGVFEIFPDSWRYGINPPTAQTLSPPSDQLRQPINGFGLVWLNNSHVFGQLGWATMCEIVVDLLVQPFSEGQLIRVHRFHEFTGGQTNCFIQELPIEPLGTTFALFDVRHNGGDWRKLH